jgi:Fic family protein
LAQVAFTIGGDVAADVGEAEIAIARLDARAVALTNTEVLARLLLRAESVASSHIEGLAISPQRLLRASSEQSDGGQTSDRGAAEVLANVDAMEYAVQGAGDISIERLVEVHRRLLAPTRAAEYAGVVRAEQNWIGGSNYTPIGASFVPPPPEEVMRLLDDLCVFCNDDMLPTVVQAALAHAQFETIHPFADGNGRTGRALIHMILRRRGLARRVTPPISLVLATRSREYVERLDATRYVGAVTSAVARAAIDGWVAFFATACTRAVADAELFEQRVSEIQATWRQRLKGTRSDSTALALVEWLPAVPVISATAAAERTGRTFAAANNALTQLAELNIVTPAKSTKRNRTFEATELIDAFTILERRLSSPGGDTRIEKPLRRVPARPRDPSKK